MPFLITFPSRTLMSPSISNPDSKRNRSFGTKFPYWPSARTRHFVYIYASDKIEERNVWRNHSLRVPPEHQPIHLYLLLISNSKVGWLHTPRTENGYSGSGSFQINSNQGFSLGNGKEGLAWPYSPIDSSVEGGIDTWENGIACFTRIWTSF